jgi:phosphinothricin acetyltransferase
MPAIAAIYRHHVLTGTATFEEVPPDEVEIARRRADVAGRGLPYLVAVAQGVDGGAAGPVLGFAYAAPHRARSAYRFTLEDSIYVADGMAGRGIGRALLTGLIAGCERLGYRQMVAVIGGSANLASIRLHAALGFAPAGLLPAVGYKFGRWIDTVLMQRPLGAGDGVAPGETGAPGEAGGGLEY